MPNLTDDGDRETKASLEAFRLRVFPDCHANTIIKLQVYHVKDNTGAAFGSTFFSMTTT